MKDETATPLKSAPFINKRELARRLPVCERTIDGWIKQGLIPCLKINRTVLFDWDAVKTRLEEDFGLNNPQPATLK